MSKGYRNFLKLLEQWPLDPTKTGRYCSFFVLNPQNSVISSCKVPPYQQQQFGQPTCLFILIDWLLVCHLFTSKCRVHR